jgi:hypothetical protein
MQSKPKDQSDSVQPRRAESPSKVSKPLTDNNPKEKKPADYITKNMQKLKKINIEEIIDSETPKVSQKPTPSVTRAKSMSRPVSKRLTEDSKQVKTEGLEKSITSIHFKDSQIENLLKIDEKSLEQEGRASPLRPFTPSKAEEKPFKRSSSKAPDNSNEITTSLRSQEVLANKFIKEFHSALADMQKVSETIDLKSAIDLLAKLRFLKNDSGCTKQDEESSLMVKLWKLINGELTAKVQNLLCVLLNILHLYSPSGHLADASCTGVKSWMFVNGIFVYNSDEALKIHRMFYQLYQNRRLAPKKVTESQDLSSDYSFKPQINRVSRDLASEGRNRYGSLGSQKREDFLNKKKEEVLKQRDQLVKKTDEIEVNSCTFQPTLLARSGSKQKKPEIVLKNPAPKPEPRKAPVLKKVPGKVQDFTSPKSEKPKIEVNQEFYSAKVQKEIERMKKVRDEKEKKAEGNIFRHKKSNSFANNEGPVKAFNLRPSGNQKVDLKKEETLERLTDRSEVLHFDNNLSLNSPLLISDTKSVEVFDDQFDKRMKTFEDEEIPDESIDSSVDVARTIPSLKVPNHAAALQLITFINEHNLSEDSAEKLLQIFSMTPKK